MSTKESDKQSEVELTGWASYSNFIWNSRTGEFMGRTGSSWAKIILFYIVFYIFLAAFWLFMLYIFMETINDERPKWTLDESRIGANPGLGFRPSPPIEDVDSTLIKFRPGSSDSFAKWTNDLDSFLKPYREAYRVNGSACRNFARNDKCPFIVNVDDSPCGRDYGFGAGSPCILIKLNRIFDWKPEPFRNNEEIRNAKNENEDPNFKRSGIEVVQKDLQRGEGIVGLFCQGETANDKESLGKIQYWPVQGFPVEYYPYTNQPGYLSPFVLVKFNSVKRGSTINIECTAHARNIAIKKQDREGTVRFELLLDE